jgi:hypothetical protein
MTGELLPTACDISRDAGGQSAGLGGQPLDHAFKSENELVK